MIGIATIVGQAATWLRAIRIVNGYATDAGAHVVTEAVGMDGNTATLIVAVYLSDLTLVKSTPMRRDWQMEMQVEARIPVSSKTAEAQALAVLEDVIHAIPTKSCDMPSNFQTLDVAGGSIQRQPDGVPYIVVGVTLRGTCYEYTSQPA